MAVLFALFIVVFIGAMAISIDVGSWYLAQRKLQTEADLAAVSAALSLEPGATDPSAKPRAAAERTAVGNGLASSAVAGVTPKTFAFDTSVPIDERLKGLEAGDLPNAVTAELRQNTPVYFASLFLPQDHLTLNARASATKADFAAFTLGSRLARLNETGALNALLEAALGSNARLDLLDYDALLDADVSLLGFVDALRTELNLEAANYKDLLDAEVDTPQIVDAILRALPSTDSNRTAVEVLANVVSNVATKTLTIRQLIAIDAGVADLHVNDILDPIHVSALDILMASVDIINAEQHRIIDLPLNLNIPGIAGVEAHLLIGERESETGWITVGGSGATLHTAQIRLKTKLTVGSGAKPLQTRRGALLGLIPLYEVIPIGAEIPIYIEVASATATLNEFNCRAASPNEKAVSFSTGQSPFDLDLSDWESPGGYFNRYADQNHNGPNDGTAIVALYIGNFPDDVLRNTTKSLSPKDLTPGKLITVKIPVVNLDILELRARSAIYVGASRSAETVFTQAEALIVKSGQGPVLKTIGSSLNISGLVGQLLKPGTVEITTAPVTGLVGLVSTLLGTVLGLLDMVMKTIPGDLIAFLLTPVDMLIDEILDLLGLSIGQMDLSLHGVSCGNVTLVR